VRKEQQYSQLYGEYVNGTHAIGDQISTTHGETGTVIWVYEVPHDRILHSLMYVVDTGAGFPVEVPCSEIVQAK